MKVRGSMKKVIVAKTWVQSLIAESHLQLVAGKKKMGFQSYNLEELNFANNLNRLRRRSLNHQ